MRGYGAGPRSLQEHPWVARWVVVVVDLETLVDRSLEVLLRLRVGVGTMTSCFNFLLD